MTPKKIKGSDYKCQYNITDVSIANAADEEDDIIISQMTQDQRPITVGGVFFHSNTAKMPKFKSVGTVFVAEKVKIRFYKAKLIHEIVNDKFETNYFLIDSKDLENKHDFPLFPQYNKKIKELFGLSKKLLSTSECSLMNKYCKKFSEINVPKDVNSTTEREEFDIIVRIRDIKKFNTKVILELWDGTSYKGNSFMQFMYWVNEFSDPFISSMLKSYLEKGDWIKIRNIYLDDNDTLRMGDGGSIKYLPSFHYDVNVIKNNFSNVRYSRLTCKTLYNENPAKIMTIREVKADNRTWKYNTKCVFLQYFPKEVNEFCVPVCAHCKYTNMCINWEKRKNLNGVIGKICDNPLCKKVIEEFTYVFCVRFMISDSTNTTLVISAYGDEAERFFGTSAVNLRENEIVAEDIKKKMNDLLRLKNEQNVYLKSYKSIRCFREFTLFDTILTEE